MAYQKTVPYTSEQNGAIERENRTVIELARTLLHTSGLPIKIWAEAVNYAVYIQSDWKCSSKDMSLGELWLKRKPNKSQDFRRGSLCTYSKGKETQMGCKS